MTQSGICKFCKLPPVHTRICTHTHTCKATPLHTQRHTRTHIHTHTRARMHTHTHTYTHTCLRVGAHIPAHAQTRICPCARNMRAHAQLCIHGERPPTCRQPNTTSTLSHSSWCCDATNIAASAKAAVNCLLASQSNVQRTTFKSTSTTCKQQTQQKRQKMHLKSMGNINTQEP